MAAVDGHSPVPIVGGTGALGFGLALRLAREGVPVAIGSRSAERARGANDRDGFHGWPRYRVRSG